MSRYIINIDPENEAKLNMFGKIMWRSNLVKGLYIINTNNNLSFLQSLPFIKNIERDWEGKMNERNK